MSPFALFYRINTAVRLLTMVNLFSTQISNDTTSGRVSIENYFARTCSLHELAQNRYCYRILKRVIPYLLTAYIRSNVGLASHITVFVSFVTNISRYKTDRPIISISIIKSRIATFIYYY